MPRLLAVYYSHYVFIVHDRKYCRKLLTDMGALWRCGSWDQVPVLTSCHVASLVDIVSWTSEGYVHPLFSGRLGSVKTLLHVDLSISQPISEIIMKYNHVVVSETKYLT